MKDEKTIYRFTYKWTDDSAYNNGDKENDGYFIGTEEEFDQMRQDLQEGFGFDCWEVKKAIASDADLKEYEWWK